MQRSFWGNLFKPLTATTKRFTVEELRELYAVLTRNPVVTEANRALVVETVRSIAEYMIWGDQNEPRIFDFFLENNVMTYLHKVLLQPANRTGEVAKQVLQTLSIIIQNVRSETAIFFLFSNNHINNIVDLDYDFSDEEVLGYYISFLKTISLKLNRGTVQFFLNTDSTHQGFALYTRAIRLAHNKEGMVRAAVRTLTLHVYSIDDPDIQAFVTAPPANQYFADVAAYLVKQIELLDHVMLNAESGGSQALASLDSQLAEVEDVLSYISDLLSLGVPGIAQQLAGSLWQSVVYPLLLQPLMDPEAAAGAPQPTARQSSSSSRPRSSGGGKSCSHSRIRPVCAIFVLERLFHLVMYPPLLQQLLLALACSSSSTQDGANSSSTSNYQAANGSTTVLGKPGSSSSSVSCRSSLLGILAGNQLHPAVLVLRLLVAILHNRHVSHELLSALSILPRRCQQQAAAGGANHFISSSSGTDASQLGLLVQAVMSHLQTLDSGQQSAADGGSSHSQQTSAGQHTSRPGELFHMLTQQYWPNQLYALVRGLQQGADEYSNTSSNSSQGLHHAMQLLQGLIPSAGYEAAGPNAPSSSGDSSSTFTALGCQLVAALLQLLQQPGLPAMGLRLAGWLLHQLLPVAPLGSEDHSGTTAQTDDAAAYEGNACNPVAGVAGIAHRGTASAHEEDAATHQTGSRSSHGDSYSGSRELSRTSSASALSIENGSLADMAQAQPPVSAAAPSSNQSLQYSMMQQQGSLLSVQQQQQVQAAANAAQATFAQQLGGMWCEAVFPLLGLEWPASRDSMLRPVLRAGSDALLSGTAVWPVLQGLQQQQQPAAAAAPSEALSVSAQAALQCYSAVQRVVALSQLQELLHTGGISQACPVPTLSEAELRQVDIQEGYQVDLAPGAALPCVVSFAPGQERRVHFAVAGLSRKQLAAIQQGQAPQSASPTAAWQADIGNAQVASQQQQQQEQQALAGLVHSLPVTVLADPSPSRPQAGVVLSVAPLLGARPATDAAVAKWLHVHVRPSVRGLLRIVKTAAAKKGGLLCAMRQLADGHWVLAFSSPDKAAGAVKLVEQHAEHLKRLYSKALAPLCEGHARAGSRVQGQLQVQQLDQQQQQDAQQQQCEQQGVHQYEQQLQQQQKRPLMPQQHQEQGQQSEQQRQQQQQMRPGQPIPCMVQQQGEQQTLQLHPLEQEQQPAGIAAIAYPRQPAQQQEKQQLQQGAYNSWTGMLLQEQYHSARHMEQDMRQGLARFESQQEAVPADQMSVIIENSVQQSRMQQAMQQPEPAAAAGKAAVEAVADEPASGARSVLQQPTTDTVSSAQAPQDHEEHDAQKGLQQQQQQKEWDNDW